jgi:hypothetical protein
MESAAIAAVKTFEKDSEAWNAEWLKFPTVTRDEAGLWHYWVVSPDTGLYKEDWRTGEVLARETVAQMQKFPDGASVLRRIMREIDHESIVAQGFYNRIEDMLTRPEVYLESLEPGAVQAKLRGD